LLSVENVKKPSKGTVMLPRKHTAKFSRSVGSVVFTEKWKDDKKGTWAQALCKRKKDKSN